MKTMKFTKLSYADWRILDILVSQSHAKLYSRPGGGILVENDNTCHDIEGRWLKRMFRAGYLQLTVGAADRPRYVLTDNGMWVACNRKPLQARILEAFKAAGKSRMDYGALMRAVFPCDQYPRAWNYAAGGGPPGCSMALSAMLKRMGLQKFGAEVYLPSNLKGSLCGVKF